jgi:hypothetical protein
MTIGTAREGKALQIESTLDHGVSTVRDDHRNILRQDGAHHPEHQEAIRPGHFETIFV